MLSISQEIVNQLTPYQNALNTALDVMTSLPLVGEELSELQEWNTVFQNSVTSLASHVDSLTNGHFELAIPLPSLSKTFTFDLGLDAFLQVKTSGGVSAAINPVLNVGFDLANGVPSLDPTHTGLDIGFVIGLPNFQLTASLKGLLYAQAVDNGTTFSGNLGFNFDTNFGIQSHFAGDAHVQLGLSLSLVDPALNASFNPRFFSDLELDWGFDTQGSQLKVPVIAFRNFSLDADSFMQGFLGDTVKGVQKFTKPMQPFIDMFEQPVPIVSSFDSSETMGDLFLKGAGLSEAQQDSFNTMVKIVKAVNTFDFSGTTGGAVINFGDILLTGDARQTGQFFFDTTQLQGVIDDIMNSPALQEVQDKLETVAEYVGFTADAGFKYPLLENPGPVIGSLLTGQTEIMFSYSTGRQHFELGASYGVGIPNVLGFFLNAGIVFDASLSVGYDTAGLLKFIQDPQPESLLHGFYIDNSIDNSGPPIPNVPNPRKSALYLQGHADISASAVVTVSGGLYADIAFELASNSVSTHVYLDDIITSLSNNVKVFNPSGRLYAAANLELTLPNPVGPDITLFSYQLGYQELLSFNIPPAPTPTLPLTVIDVTDQHTLLLDVTKMTAQGSVKVQPFHDYPITSGIGYMGDGIRVDYPNEIVMYVERKNDITTNYYNFVGLSGAVPDGVSIDIVDPFTVFTTEGAPDPQPPQTESGVLLAGGKNVIYRYAENSGGSLATVLLVGGYGSNTLTGGTMTFGSFVPAARIDQAKNHFGNLTGFDAAGQAYINARLDSVLAPASPAGIIGATMTGGRGGLMYGGPGNNSFIATGPGDYEMVGGTWTNNFTISPSYGGVPATYQIDGGPYGQSTLVVRVPSLEHVSFGNSAIVDKYTPTLKALAVQANAGLSATAHGIRKVSIVAAVGSEIELGDTSELNIEFTTVGASRLSFGGTNAPDTFTVSSDYNFYGREDLRYVRQLVPNRIDGGLKELPPGNYAGNDPVLYDPHPVDRVDSPVYTIIRTFGTNGRTQTVTFKVDNPLASALRLDGKGARDTYNITQGLGSFLDIEVRDSDTSTQNTVNVDFRNPLLLPQTATLTNNVLRLNYYTPMTLFTTHWWNGLFFDHYPSFYFYSTSAAYTPAVYFGANVDITFRTGRPFQQTIIDRDSPPIGQLATILFDGVLDEFEAPGVLGWDADYMVSPTQRGFLWYEARGDYWRTYYTPTIRTQAYDTQHPEAGYLEINAQFYQSPTATAWNYYLQPVGSNVTGVTVLSNTGDLTIEQSSIGLVPQYYYVLGNTGTIRFKKTDAGINSYFVNGNEGTINYEIARAWGPSSTRDLFAVYGNSGTINFNHTITGTYRGDGYIVGLDHVINVLGNTGVVNVNTTVAPYLINYGIETQVNVGEGTLAGVHGTINLSNTNGHYGLKIDDRGNPGAGAAWSVDYNNTKIGDLTINYLGVNRPAPYFDSFSNYAAFPKSSSPLSLKFDPPFYYKSYSGGAFPAITVSAPSSLFNTSGDTVNRTISATGPSGAPLTFTASNLPPGLSINGATGLISGTITPGAWAATPYETIVTVAAGQFSRAARIYWYVASGIAITVDESNLSHFEGESASATISGTNVFNLPVTFTVTNLPPGIFFDANTSTISGTISPGVAQNGPYYVNIHATDGVETADSVLYWYISGITLNPPASQIDFVGDSVNLAFQGSTVSGAPLVYAAEGLPDGLSIDANTGVISGVVTAAAAETRWYYPTITATNGNDSAEVYFAWTALPVGIANYISMNNPGNQFLHENDYAYLYLQPAFNSLGLSLTYTVTGLPPGLELQVGEGDFGIFGMIASGTAANSPYHVQLLVTDGIWSDTANFDISVAVRGSVSFGLNLYYGLYSSQEDTIGFTVPATSSLNETITYSATGLPPGITINPQTGFVSGQLELLSAVPGRFQVKVTATAASGSDSVEFLWHVLGSEAGSHVLYLPHPSGTGVVTVTSPEGTEISASISPQAGVALPNGVSFPFGFVTFAVRYLTPGQAADVIIAGLDLGGIEDYYKYGATPANSSEHWYNFLFGQATDGDSAVGTGMEIVGGNIVLHLIDGGRGDDDLAKNGVIQDIGGPAKTAITSTVVGRRVFYNQSKFDGNTSGVSASDDLAIATDKVALLPGAGQATFANMTSYTRGINGIMVDIQGSHGTLTASDFIFKVGANNTPSLWASPLETPTVTVRAGAGTGGSDRVEIIFTAANSPKNQWLEVIVKGNDTRGGFNTNTGLAASDIFFFGNRIGEDGSGTVGQAITSFVDENGAKTHSGAATVTNVWDFDRSGLVSSVDSLAARFNSGTLLKINIANPPAAPEAAPAVALAGAGATDNGVASALAVKSVPKVEKLPSWISERLSSLHLHSGPIRGFITDRAHEVGLRARAILTATDSVAEKLEWDDALLDELLAEL